MQKLTAMMIVRNEESMLPGCLESLRGVCDALVILDTGSTDRTAAMLGELEASAGESGFASVVIDRIEMSGFGSARAEALSRVRSPWTLWIDADERLSPALAAEIRGALEDGGLERRDAWRIPFRNVVLGHTMRCRELGDEDHLRLFRSERGRFGTEAVHEGLHFDATATTGRLASPIIHHTLRSWSAYLAKVDHYTRLEAEHSDRRCNLLHLLLTAPSTFLRQYLRRTCIIDGRAGLVWALTSAWSAWLRDWRICRKGFRD